jgi:uncharacterized protein (TIGR00255 family)
MTGYGRAVAKGAGGQVSAEVRAVNGRFLKLSVRLPPELAALEERVRERLDAAGLKRGSVEVTILVSSAKRGRTACSLNMSVLRAYAAQAKRLVKTLGLKQELPLAALLALPGAVESSAALPNLDRVWAGIRPVLDRALAACDRMRRREGEALAADLNARLGELGRQREVLAEAAPKAKAAAVARFKERVSQLLSQTPAAAVPSGQLEREIVLLCDRLDVSEELARLASHCAQMEQTLARGGEAGKKLEFLSQELLRETNTLGAKCSDPAMTHVVVEMKGLIEKVREQVQNLA